MKVLIKLKKKHPKNSMALGRHNITNESKLIELNEDEAKELKQEGPIHWFEFCEAHEDGPAEEIPSIEVAAEETSKPRTRSRAK